MIAGSLFSGCGGLDLGLERAGWTIGWRCESDATCRRVLRRHWRGRCFHDVRDVDERASRVDLLAGGFPCQPISVAGLKRAQRDERWLWPEFARCIRLLRPRLVLVENVPGIANAGLGDVLGDLAAASYVGYVFRLRASDVGAPHRRERVFVVATDPDRPRREGAEPEQADGRPGFADGPATDPGGRAHGPDAGRAPSGQASLRPDGADRSWGGAAATPDPARQREHGAGSLGTGRRAEPANGGWGQYAPAIRRWERLFGDSPRPIDDRGRLVPAFVEWLMGFPDGWTAGEGRGDRLRMLGNAVQVQVAEVVGRVAATL